VKSELIDALDTAMQRMLDKAGLGAPLPADAPRLDIVDQAKVFDAAVAWVKTRQTLTPAGPTESPFDGLRAKFNSPPVKRRRGRAAPEAEVDPGIDAGGAEPAGRPVGGADGGNGEDVRPGDGDAGEINGSGDAGSLFDA
jgi:hypothetical protein